MTIAEILDVDVILLTHLHPDHWDAKAQEVVPKDQLLLLQNEQDCQALLSRALVIFKLSRTVQGFGGLRCPPQAIEVR